MIINCYFKKPSAMRIACWVLKKGFYILAQFYHFKDLFSKNINISLKVWTDNFVKWKLFNKNFVLTKELLQIIKVWDTFLAQLECIENSVVEKTCEVAQKNAIKVYKWKQMLKSFQRSPFSKISEKEFASSIGVHTTNVTIPKWITILLDIKNLYLKLADLKFYNVKRNLPLSVSKLIFLNDYEIISFYNILIKNYLNWFRCVDNLTSVKNIIWILRMSCLKTLARKHKKNLKWSLIVFTINVVTESPYGTIFSLPSIHEIFQLNAKFLLESHFQQPEPWDLLKKYLLIINSSWYLFFKCSVGKCFNTDIEISHIRKLSKRVILDKKISLLTFNNKWLSAISVALLMLNCRHILLCSTHHSEFEKGNYNLLDIAFFKNNYNLNLKF